MKTLTVTEVARNFSAVMDGVESEQEEIVLVRIQDLWLASQAIQRDFTVLTANAKDFKDVPELKFVVVKVP